MMMDNIQDKDNTESSESQVSSPAGTVLNAPKFGIVVPNRVFVGGISSQTTENDLAQLFSSYGRVINTKIIADRAGVSKGYGFVTFETEEEAKRLQQDAESIILRERRLNIAPAIKKQGYQRPYDCMTPATESPVQMTSGQMYRQPGVPFFQNGMAFYAPVAAPTPQPTQPMTPIQSPVDGPQMYSPGAYGGVAQNTSAPNYTFSYQNPIYYQAPYPYHLALEGYPVSEGTQMAPNNVIVPAASIESGGVLFAASPYIFAQQPATQQPYFDPQNLSPMPPTTSQEAAPPQLFYSSARSYEPPTFVYAENRNQQPTTNGASPSALPAPQIPLAICDSTDGQEVALSGPQQRPEHPNFLQPEGSTRGRTPRGRGGRCNYARGGAFKPFPRPLQSYPKNYQNNNDPKCSDRNSYPNTTYVNRKYYGLYPPRSSRPPTYPESPAKHPYPNSYPNSSNHSPPQVPAVPYIPGVRPHYGILPFSPRRGGLASRGKYTGRGGKPLKSQTWTYSRDGSDIAEDGNALANALTPPITPRSPHDPSEDLAASLQGLNI